MEPLIKLESNLLNKSPYDIFTWLFDNNGKEKEGFDLTPRYQRNVVWETKQYLKFIESIFIGIVPSPIIIAINPEENKKTCVDGKQRLTSIKEFFTNKIPYFRVFDNKIILYWYNIIQDNKSINKILEDIYQIKNFENKLITKEMKNWTENQVQLSIIQYFKIDYKQQIDIFNRIQYGKIISRGSYLKSFIQDEELCKHIMKIADKYKEYFNKYIKNVNNEDHIKYMIEIFLMLEKNISTIKTETVDYELKNMTIKKFNKMDIKYDNLIKIMFSNELLNNNEFKQKKVVINCLLFANEKMVINKFDKNKMKLIFEKIYYEINEEKKQFKSDELKNYIHKLWNNKNIIKNIIIKKSKNDLSDLE